MGQNMLLSTLAIKGLTSKVLSRATIARAARREAKEQGKDLVVRRGKPRKEMTQATKAKRLKFALANKSRGWDRVLFTDRKRFYFSYPGSKVKGYRYRLRSKGEVEDKAAFQPNHPQCLNIYAGISRFGITPIHVVAGSSKHKTTHTNKKGQPAKSITMAEYRDVLSKTLLPEGSKLFQNQGITSWVLQQDGDPSHSCAHAEVKKWNKAHHSKVEVLLNWPPNSPDLNLIENVWSAVQEKVNRAGCNSFEEFKDKVVQELEGYPKKSITKLFKSMDKRVSLVVANGGGPTKY
jgi:hypothetical protein